jgi:hypothetical protein
MRLPPLTATLSSSAPRVHHSLGPQHLSLDEMADEPLGTYSDALHMIRGDAAGSAASS